MPRASPAIPERPIHCRACGYEVTGLPHVAGVRTCPECGRGVGRDGANVPPPRPPEVRCPGCGYNLVGIPRISNNLNCPECNLEVDLVYGATLEPWPGDREVIKRTLWFNPWGVVCTASLIFLTVAARGGTVSNAAVLFGVAVGAALSIGEAVVQARKAAWACWSRRERDEVFHRMAMIGGSVSLAIWSVIALGAVVFLYLL